MQMALRIWVVAQIAACVLLLADVRVYAAVDPAIQLTVNSTSIRDGDMVKVYP